MQFCLNLQSVPFQLYCCLFLTSPRRKFLLQVNYTVNSRMLESWNAQKLLSFCMSVKYLFLLLFQAFVSLFYPGDQALTDHYVFSSFTWCTVYVNVSDQKMFSFLPCVVFLHIHGLQTFIVFSFPRQYREWI